MAPTEFYDLSFEEWYAALEGLHESLGLTDPAAPEPVTDADFEDWDPELFEPSQSIAA